MPRSLVPRAARAVPRALLAAALLAPAAAGAQRIVFEPLEWGSPADSVRPRMEALGWRYLHANQEGDVWMTSDTATLIAVSGGGRLVEVQVEHAATDEGLAARHRALLDSLRAAFGAPAGEHDGWTIWERGLAQVGVRAVPGSGTAPAHVLLRFVGPGGMDEERRRYRMGPVDDPFPALPPGWVVLRLSPRARISIDTASVSARGAGVHRARIRLDQATVTDDPSGAYDALVYGSDFDCAGGRVQMRSRTALLRGRQVRTDSGATVWVSARPGTRERFQLDVVCGYVAERSSRS